MQHLTQCAGGLRLRDILSSGRFTGGHDIFVRSCCADSGSCRPGDLYVALVGGDCDGHDDVDRAIERGATAVVAERLLPVCVPTCIVDDSREAYGRICQQLAGQPARFLETIGVTGTLGKTMTSTLIGAVLKGAGQQVGITGQADFADTEGPAPIGATSLTPPALAASLARMASRGCTHAVLEVSSQSLSSRHIAGLGLDGAVLTNLRRDHLDQHGTVENYRRAKLRLFDHLKPGGFAVLNADDRASIPLIEQLDIPLMTVGIHQDAQLRAQLIERCESEQIFLLIAGQEAVPVRTRTVGDPYIYACLSAAAVGLIFGIRLARIASGLESVESIPGRMQRIECGQPFSVYVDHAQTPDALAASLHALRQVADGRVLCVYGAAHWQDAQQRAAFGRVAERSADLGIITSTHPGYEQPLRIAHDILDGVRRPSREQVIPDRRRAIFWALQHARPGDAVLIAGKGDEPCQQIGSVELPMDDRAVTRRWLYGDRPKEPDVTSTAILPMRLGCQWN